MEQQGVRFGTNRTRTICEVLREINDRAQGDGELRQHILIALELGKRLAWALVQYKASVLDGWFAPNPFWTESERKRREVTYKLPGAK